MTPAPYPSSVWLWPKTFCDPSFRGSSGLTWFPQAMGPDRNWKDFWEEDFVLDIRGRRKKQKG